MAKRITFSSQSELFEALTSNDQRQQNRGFDYIYDEIYGSFRQWVYTVKKGSEDDARDAFQSALLNFIVNIREGKYKLHPEAKITTVVFSYCKGLYLNFINSASFIKRDELPEHLSVVDTSDMPDKTIERNETVMEIRDCLKKIGSDCKDLITWFYIEDMSLTEIAEKLKINVAAAKQRLFVCRQKLRVCISPKM